MSRLRNGLLVLLLLICAGSFWLARERSAPVDASGLGAEGADHAPVNALAAGSVHLTVLNGTAQPGLARRFARELPAFGCVVVAVADAPHDSFAVSLLINRRLQDRAARQLALSLADVPVVREWDFRSEEDAVLVLGADHARILGLADVGP
jgi:hypothetical protein